MEEKLTTHELAETERLALKLIRSPNKGLAAAARNFVPRCAKLRAALSIVESDEAMQEAAQE